MSRFLTLKRTDPDFLKYIWGHFSKSERAIPIESLNIGTAQESVTFKIQSTESVHVPSRIILFLHLIKWKYFFLVFVPLYYVFIKNLVEGGFFDFLSFSLAAIASIFLFSGLNIRNDVLDHVSGFDRIIKSSGEKPILRGWITAQKANQLSWIFIFMAGVLAIPVCVQQQEALWIALLTAMLFLTGNFLNKNNYKFKYFSEFILFLILGPTLCSGYQVSMGAGIDNEILVFGTAWGVAILFLLYLVQFANLFETSQGGIKNTLTHMGFDKSKIFLKCWWGMFIFLWIAYHYFYSGTYWGWLGAAVLIFQSRATFDQISQAHSPMGSALQRVRESGFRIFVMMVILLVVEQSWSLYIHLNGIA